MKKDSTFPIAGAALSQTPQRKSNGKRFLPLLWLLCCMTLLPLSVQAQVAYDVYDFNDLTTALSDAASTINITIKADFDMTFVMIPPNKTVTITSDAGGPYTLTRDASETGILFTVSIDAVLTLEDITIDGNGGTVSSDRLIYVNSNSGLGTYGTLNIGQGVTLQNNAGGGVINTGIFNMTDGIITGNSSPASGGGVNNSGTFTMSGGSITLNSAVNGGGGVNNFGTFIMNGGAIMDNSAGYGGGMYLYNNGVFEMSDGSITDNSATTNGDGIYWYNNAGDITVSGTAKIGTATDGNAITRTVSTQKIKIGSGGLTSGANIYVDAFSGDAIGTVIAEGSVAIDVSASVGFFNYPNIFDLAASGTAIELTAAPYADLTIQMFTDKSIPVVGETVTLGITVRNFKGPDNAPNVKVSLTDLSTKLTNIVTSPYTSGPWTAWSNPQSLGTINFSVDETFFIRGTVISNAAITLTATVSSDMYDPVSADNTASVTLLSPTDYGLLFDVATGKVWLDLNHNGAIDDPGDLEYPPLPASWNWNSGTQTLTLNNFAWTTPARVALTILNGNLTVNLNGTNTFESKFSGTPPSLNFSAGIYTPSSQITITGNGTLDATGGNIVGAGTSVDTYGIYGRLTVAGGTVNAKGGTAAAAGSLDGCSFGVISGNSITIKGGILNATGGLGTGGGGGTGAWGVHALISSTISGGTVEASGSTGAFRQAPVLPSAYTWWANNAATTNPGGAGTLFNGSGTAYTYSASDQYVKIESTRIAVVSDVTVSGTAEQTLTPQTATVTLFGETVGVALTNNNAASWFAGVGSLPAGITVAANATAGSNIITLTFGGMPSAVSTAAFNITVPASALSSGGALALLPNPNAKFDITGSGTVNPPVTPSVAPRIYGSTWITLATGYTATSSDAYSITGDSPVTVTKTSGDSHITWNDATRKLDIAAGLPEGEYRITLGAVNSVGTFTLTVTLTVVEPVYYLDAPRNVAGGTLKVITNEPYIAAAGETVTLVITSDKGYELESIAVYDYYNKDVAVTLNCTDNACTFTMPAHHIRIVVVFRSITTANEQWTMDNGQLKAWTANGVLYVSGIADGATLRVYNIFGMLVEASPNPSEGGEFVLPLPGRGVYIITDGKRVVKVNN